MSPNAMVSSTDSTTFQTASATQSTTSLTQITAQTGTDTYSSSLGTTTGCKTSDFTDMKTEGPSIDVAFYCTSSSLDTSGKLSVTRLDITKFNGSTISYSMNWPNSNTLTSSQTETPSFYDSSTGQNSCSGWTTSSDGIVQCGHTTTFSYSIATYSTSSSSNWWTGISNHFFSGFLKSFKVLFWDETLSW